MVMTSSVAIYSNLGKTKWDEMSKLDCVWNWYSAPRNEWINTKNQQQEGLHTWQSVMQPAVSKLNHFQFMLHTLQSFNTQYAGLEIYVTKYVSWSFPVCTLQSVLANPLLQASFPVSRGYVTCWHSAYPPLGPVTLDVNTCIFPHRSCGTAFALKSFPASEH